jgi:HIRAN domain
MTEMTDKPHKKARTSEKEHNLNVPLVGMNYRVGVQLQLEFAHKTPFRVQIEREAENKFDPNALKVVATEIRPGMQIGYVSRGVAARLAPLIDSGRIDIEAAAVIDIDETDGSGTVLISYRRKFTSKP